MQFYAHSAPTGRDSDFEPLRDHLKAVADRAADFAAVFGAEDEARFTGLLHDLGKYSEAFQARLRGEASGLDHWSPGAYAACKATQRSLAAIFSILGHHLGLPSADAVKSLEREQTTGRNAKGSRWTETSLDLLLTRLCADGLEPSTLESMIAVHAKDGRAATMLDVRMLFSALVDADFLETERFFSRFDPQSKPRPVGRVLEAERALSLLDSQLAELAAARTSAPAVQGLRADLLAACRTAAEGSPGLYTLTAPTGSGKTLAMLAFALRHAAIHGLRRVVVAVPYLSILEQTVGTYSRVLGADFDSGYLLEHHSLADMNRPRQGSESTAERWDDSHEDGARAEDQRRLLAENWDAPLVITTNVQVLESLFSNRPAACRKLHNLANSVIVFDEAQSLPTQLAIPTLAALSRLAERYGATIVFATATQPAFDHLHAHVEKLAPRGWQPREIVPQELNLFDRAKRTRVVWDLAREKSFGEVAEELAAAPQALVIVNLKRHARQLAEELLARVGGEGLFHLSTNLCPEHRSRVLAEVRQRLCKGKPCRVVATQCIEAGVDVDFPIVLRAFGPLDSIAQAAGRCNRNGKASGLGEVRVFRWQAESAGRMYPPGAYENAVDTVAALLTENGGVLDLDDPETFRRYYRRLYDATRIGQGQTPIERSIWALDFPEVAKLYNLIEKNSVEVLVPFNPEAFTRLRSEAKARGHLSRDWIREARRFAVSVFRPESDVRIEPLAPPRDGRPPDWYALVDPSLYDRKLFGLTDAPDLWIA